MWFFNYFSCAEIVCPFSLTVKSNLFVMSQTLSAVMLTRFVQFLQITEDFLAAYQANYGFTGEGDQAANNATASSKEPAATEPDKKLSDKEKPGDATQDVKQHETPAKEAKQKGEKRKAEPGYVSIRVEIAHDSNLLIVMLDNL